MTSPMIYKSIFPPVRIPEQSIFTHVLGSASQPNFSDNLPAFIDAVSGKVVDRDQLRDQSLRLAYGLVGDGDAQILAKRGGPTFVRGDVIGIYSPNSLSFTLALYGGFAAGVKVSPINSSYIPSELAHQLSLSQAKVVVVHPNPQFISNLYKAFQLLQVSEDEASKRIVVADWMEDPVALKKNLGQYADPKRGLTMLTELLQAGKMEQEANFDGRYAHETALICFSSGTTGLAKGVETTHHNLVAIMCMFPACFISVRPGVDKWLGFLPGYHIYGLVKVILYPLSKGGTTVIVRGWDIQLVGETIKKHQITMIPLVPPVMLLMAKHPAFDKFDFSSVRIITSGAAPLGADLTFAVVQRLKKLGANVVVTQGYGLTETSPTATFNVAEYWESKAGTVGPLLPNLEARLVQDDGSDAPVGGKGELWLRGPTIMKGYLRNPSATLGCITSDGWFQTGDVATCSEDGFFTIVDRKKELIKYKGFQVPPADLEAVLLEHPDVSDSGVIGVYSEKHATELPRAYIVPRVGSVNHNDRRERERFAQEVGKWIMGKVAKHKYLRGGVVVVEAIPKSAAGKILRKELKERAKKEGQSEEVEPARL